MPPCNGSIATQSSQFIFGYGSLICSHSRAVTAPEHAHTIVTPVLVRGMERVWSKRTNVGMTAMGIRFNVAASTVGVLLPVTPDEIQKFDVREQGYDRIELRLTDIHRVPFLSDEHYQQHDPNSFVRTKTRNDNATESVKVWVYIQQDNLPPTEEHPIVQSYVDTILRGCLTVGGEEFARAFIETTKGWHPDECSDSDDDHGDSAEDRRGTCSSSESEDGSDCNQSVWVNDRRHPVYPRGDPVYMRKHADKFDKLLHKYNAKYLRSRKNMEYFPPAPTTKQ
jgi:hypothetical protein